MSSFAYFEQELLDEHAERQRELGLAAPAPERAAEPVEQVDEVQRLRNAIPSIVARYGGKLSKRELRAELVAWCVLARVDVALVDVCLPSERGAA